MSNYGIVLGDLGPTMPVQLLDNGVPFVLVADTDVVTLNYLGPDKILRSKVLTIAVPSTGSCIAAWEAGDLPVLGPYQGLATVMRAGDSTFPRTFPNSGIKIIWWAYQGFSVPAPVTVDYINDDGTTDLTGTPVYETSAGHAASASATDLTHATVIGLRIEACLSGASGPVQSTGAVVLATGQWDAITGQSGGLMPLAAYYAGATGKLSTTPPTSGGLYSTLVGIAASASQLDLDIQIPIGPIGQALIGVTVDALSGVVIPQTDVEAERYNAYVGVTSGGPTTILPFQDAASPALDANGKNDMATVEPGAAFTAYRQAVPGWTSLGISTVNNPTDTGIGKQGGDLPSDGTNSYLSMQNVDISVAPNIDQGVMSLCDAAFAFGVRAGTNYPLLSAGGVLHSVGSKPIPLNDARFNPWLKYDIKHQIVKLYTDDEVLSYSLPTPSDLGPEVDFGCALASGLYTVTCVRSYAQVYIGPSAEKTDAEIGALKSGRRGNPITWWDAAALSADHGKFFPCGVPQWEKVNTPAPAHQYNVSESAGVLWGDVLGDVPLVALGANYTAMGLATVAPDLSRKGLSLTDGTVLCAAYSVDSRLANPQTTSVALQFVVNVTAAAHGSVGLYWSWIGGIGGAANVMIFVTTSGVFGLYVNGTLFTGTVPQFNASIPATVVVDVTNQRIVLYTPAEKITATYQSITGGPGIYIGSPGPSVPTVGGVISKINQWEGPAAEGSDAVWRERYEALGWTPAW